MLDKIRFGKRETTSLIVIAMTTQLFLGFPREMSVEGGTAAWIIPIYLGVITSILFFFISKLYKSFEGKDIFDIAEIAGGNFLRILVGLIFVTNYIFIFSITLRAYGENVKIISLVHSPLSFVILVFILGAVIASYFGIEAIGRICAIVLPIIIFGFIIIVAGNVKSFKIDNLLPIMGNGPAVIFVKMLPRISMFSSLSVLYLLAPFVGKNKDFKRIGFSSIIFSCIFLTIGVLTYILVVPYPTNTENVLPFLHMSRYVSYGRFFQRIESIFLFAWSITALIYLSFALYFLIYTIKKTFKLKYYRPLIIPIAVVSFTLSLMPVSLLTSLQLDVKIFRQYAWIVTFVIPIVVLMAAKLVERKKGGKGNEHKI